MAAGNRHGVDDLGAQFLGELRKLAFGKLAKIRGHANLVEKRGNWSGHAPNVLEWNRRPAHCGSSGSVPSGLPSRESRIFSTLLSAALSSLLQWSFSASPRS